MATINGTGLNDTLFGSTTADSIYGKAGDDTIYGLGGSDYIDGGVGADKMYGGVGSDRYVVDNTGDQVIEYANQGTDLVYSSISSYTLGNHVENLYLLGSSAYNGYGNALNNTIWGNSNNNYLYGRAGNDTIYAYGGNDYINGGAGADKMYGSTGNDRYVVDNVGDQVVEYAGQGTDLVYSSLSSYTLGSSVENLYLSGSGAYNGYGNALNNTIWGNSNNNSLHGQAGNDTIYAYGGNDYINGGTGADKMYGSTGNDRYVVDNAGDQVVEYAGQGTDLVYSYLHSYTLGSSVENLYLSGSGAYNGYGNALNNTIWGNSNNNALYGQAGNDIIYAGGGNDYINGGTGADKMYGGTGSDRYIVDNAGDQVIEYAGQGTDTVYSYVTSHSLSSSVENLYISGSGAYHGYGNALSNFISGNSNNNYLFGRAGNDSIYGHAGNDSLYGEAGNDRLFGGTGNDYLVAGTGRDTLTGFGGGTNERDTLVGDNDGQLFAGSASDKDIFVLGNSSEAFYTDSGNLDHATIWYFDRQDGDKLQVHGSTSDYNLSYIGGDTWVSEKGSNDLMAIVKSTNVFTSDLVAV